MTLEETIFKNGFALVIEDERPLPINPFGAQYAGIHPDFSGRMIRLWPSDRPGSYFVACITDVNPENIRMVYQTWPISLAAIRTACEQFFGTTRIAWYDKRALYPFANHPWITKPGDAADVGVPTFNAFLSETPYVDLDSDGIYRSIYEQTPIAENALGAPFYQPQLASYASVYKAELQPAQKGNSFDYVLVEEQEDEANIYEVGKREMLI